MRQSTARVSISATGKGACQLPCEACLRTYDLAIGVNSEEIQAEAMSTSSAVSQVFEVLKKTMSSLPEAVAQRKDETIRAKQSALRKSRISLPQKTAMQRCFRDLATAIQIYFNPRISTPWDCISYISYQINLSKERSP